MAEVEVLPQGTLVEAIRSCVGSWMTHGEACAVALSGEQSFIHRLSLPVSARRQLAEILPFELEAHVPVDREELVMDHRLLTSTDPSQLSVLAVAARSEAVSERIALVRAAVGREPVRVGCGPLPLANLASAAPSLNGVHPVALVDLSANCTEVLILRRGEPVMARTLSRGLRDLPAGAPAMAAEIRQTLAAFVARQNSEPVHAIHLLGGSTIESAAPYLAHQLGTPVEPLKLELTGVSEGQLSAVPEYAKAIGLALGLRSARDPDLRRGGLAFAQRYDFLKEKAPVLGGLLGAIVISFLFSSWAELRALGKEREGLETALGAVTKEILDVEEKDPDAARLLLEGLTMQADADPMPRADAFDILVELSKAVPPEVMHDVEELDFQRGHLRLRGIVGTKAEADTIRAAIARWECARDVKIDKITRVINEDRQKYTLEMDLRCPEDVRAPKRASAGGDE
jgi:general secretion pathway protein L